MFKVGDKVLIKIEEIPECYKYLVKKECVYTIIDKDANGIDGGKTYLVKGITETIDMWFKENELFKYDENIFLGKSKDGTDNINHPNHYKGNKGIETIDYIENIMSEEAFKGYLVGNITKYISRFDKKNGLEDVKKAQWYINKLIEKMEER